MTGRPALKPNPVARRLRDGRPALGTWITLCPHPRVVRILASAGFDFVIIEMEHTDFDLQTVGTLAMVAREAGLVPVVRPPGTLVPHGLTRPLDAGAQGLLLPAVDSAAAAEALVHQVKYHPMGQRPMNLAGPHTDYVQAPPEEIIAHLNRETLTVAMVETRAAIDALAEICRVPGIDAIMVGPDDLSQDLGVPGRLQAPEMTEAVEQVFATCRDAGMPFGMSSRDPERTRTLAAAGATWLPFKNDAAMVLDAARAAVPALRAAVGEAD
jgi:2-keto-3-deoxy-L-rhamnonate aldolase RhmA